MESEVGDVKTYEYGRIRVLAKNLQDAGIDAQVAAQILEGGELIKRGTTPEKKADWMREAMRRLDASLDLQTRRTIRERCACCTTPAPK